MKVYFIVVTYNAMRWIERCINSIYKNQCNNIVLVDNASEDNTLEFIRKNYPNVQVVPSSKNLGFGAANNIGIKIAIENGCDYIFLLNQDAYLEESSLSVLLDLMGKYPDIGILSPIHLNGTKSAFDRNFSYAIMHGTDNAYLNDLYFSRVKEIYDVAFVNAAAWLISRRCIERVGLFDSVFFHYGEDDNYCQRVRFHGFKICISPKVFVLHDREDRNGGMRHEFIKDQYLRAKLIDFSNPFKDAKRKFVPFLRHQKVEIAKSILTMNLKRFGEAKSTYLFIKDKMHQVIENSNRNKL